MALWRSDAGACHNFQLDFDFYKKEFLMVQVLSDARFDWLVENMICPESVLRKSISIKK